MNSTLFANAGDSTICGTSADSHASPALTEQSCISLQRFGVIQMKFDRLFADKSVLNRVNGTTPLAQRAAFETMSV